MSLLAGADSSGAGGEGETAVAIVERPGFGTRLVQWLLAVVAAHVIGVLIVCLTVAALVPMGIDVNSLTADRPDLVVTMSILVPVLATGLAMVAVCRGVYLAQLVGLAIGLTCAVVAPVEKLAFELSVAWYEWLLLPPLCMAAGFLMGLRVTGSLRKVVKKKIRTTDAWDPKAQSKAREITPPSELRWRRLIIGSVIGVAIVFGVRYGLYRFVRSWFAGQGHFVGAVQSGSVLPLTIIGLAAGGMLAGSRTQNGFFQGLLAGLIILAAGYVIQVYIVRSPYHDEFRKLFVYYISVPPVAGILGRYIFRPARVFKSSQDQNLG